MPQLFVKQSIEINAPAAKVWDAITKAEMTRQWIKHFGLSGAVVSDWHKGSPVQWTQADGTVIVEGDVIAVEPEKFLHYNVFDTRSERPQVSDEDGITFTLTSHNGQTLLSFTQGDFGKMTDGEKYHQASIEVWQKVLPEIKALAEG